MGSISQAAPRLRDCLAPTTNPVTPSFASPCFECGNQLARPEAPALPSSSGPGDDLIPPVCRRHARHARAQPPDRQPACRPASDSSHESELAQDSHRKCWTLHFGIRRSSAHVMSWLRASRAADCDQAKGFTSERVPPSRLRVPAVFVAPPRGDQSPCARAHRK